MRIRSTEVIVFVVGLLVTLAVLMGIIKLIEALLGG